MWGKHQVLTAKQYLDVIESSFPIPEVLVENNLNEKLQNRA